jgi:cysteinyl-tRNA synthetase
LSSWPTVQADGVTRYGSSPDVPSLLDDAPTALATVVLLATDWPEDVDRALAALERHAPQNTHVVVVADGPAAEQEAALDERSGGRPDVVWTSARLGHAAALNAGIRRARGSVVIVLDTSVEPTGDIVTPLVDVLADPTVGVAGGWGIVSADLRRFSDAPAGDVDAIEGYVLAFRRDDTVARGPLDERFRFYRNLDIWWSLVLRDQGPDEPPRRAVSVELPAIRHEHRGWTSLPAQERDRLSKRNFYRVIDRFGSRRDLISG